MRDAGRLRDVLAIIKEFREPLAVVTSAAGGMTDRLQSFLHGVASPNMADEVERRHLEMASQLRLSAESLSAYRRFLAAELRVLGRVPSRDRERALVLSLGERLMARLLAAYLSDQGGDAVYCPAVDLVRTDDKWLQAEVDLPASCGLIRERLEPLLASGKIPVVTGFIGATPAGELTLLGRNGSDYSASIVARGLDAQELWIWTDVEGVFNIDPRVCSDARLLDEISYSELAEAAYCGARIVHPYTFRPLKGTDTAVRIKCTMKPESPGTRICNSPRRRGRELIITTVDQIARISVYGHGLLGVPGVSASALEAIRNSNTDVLLISHSSSEHNITFVVKTSDANATLKSLRSALRQWIVDEPRIDRIHAEQDVAVVSVLGDNLRGRAGVSGMIYSALGEANIEALALGSSEYSISMLVRSADVGNAMRTIHRLGREAVCTC